MKTVLLTVAAALFAGHAGLAQNLLSNPDFDANVGGWTTLQSGGTTHTVSPNASSGSPTAPLGAAQLVLIDSAGDAVLGIYQCLLTGTGPYSFGGRAYIVSSTAGTGDFLFLSFYSTTNCTGAAQGSSVYADPTGTVTGISNGSTVSYTQLSKTNVSPPMGSQSVRLLANSQSSPSGGNITTLYDHMYFQCADVTAPAVTAPSPLTVTQTVCQ